MTFPLKKRVLRGLIGAVLLAVAATVHGDEITDIGKLLRGGQLDQASQRVDAFLAGKPRDAQGQFLKGLILTEQNKTADAITTFTRLTELYPELPEPYNNLAVLYAGQGNYERARQALEMAIRTHPSYATAHENLGDVYAKLASQAYDKALQLDKGNKAAQTKLNLIKDLFTGARPSTVALARTEPATKAATAPPAARPVSPAPTTTAAAPAPAPAREPAKAPTKEPAKTAPAAQSADAVLSAVQGWASAWSSNDAAGYFARYAPGFKVPGGASREAWETERKARIAKPRQIEVRVEAPKVAFNEANRATVTFRQHYRSDTFNASSKKTLVLVRSEDQWLIQEELVGG